jgi:hypothetical protein
VTIGLSETFFGDDLAFGDDLIVGDGERFAADGAATRGTTAAPWGRGSCWALPGSLCGDERLVALCSIFRVTRPLKAA